MRRAVAAVALAVLVVSAGCVGVLSSPTPTAGGEGRVATVTEVVDGDTVKVRFADGTTDTVRLLGVDTPEVHVAVSPGEYEGVPDTAAGEDCLREWGHAASDFARERLAGQQVRLVGDPNEPNRGGYDRLLRYVVVDGTRFNRLLVAEGYARVYDSDFARRDRYDAAEADAMAAGRGLWTCREPGTVSGT